MLLCFSTRRMLWNVTPNTLSCTSVLLMTFLPSGVGPKVPCWNSLTALNSKTDRIKLTYCISESSISFLDLFLYRDTSSNMLQFSTFQKPLNKYMYIPFESFHPSSCYYETITWYIIDDASFHLTFTQLPFSPYPSLYTFDTFNFTSACGYDGQKWSYPGT